MTIKVIKSGAPRPLANYNEAFVVGDLVFAAGQLASDFKTGVPPQARKQAGFPFYGSDIELQTTYILENLKTTFEAAGSSLDHVVKAQVFLTDLDHFHGFDTVWKRYFKVPPPRTNCSSAPLRGLISPRRPAAVTAATTAATIAAIAIAAWLAARLTRVAWRPCRGRVSQGVRVFDPALGQGHLT